MKEKYRDISTCILATGKNTGQKYTVKTHNIWKILSYFDLTFIEQAAIENYTFYSNTHG